MSEKQFTDVIKPPENYTPPEQVDAQAAVNETQDSILKQLSKEMSNVTFENIKKLAPLDEFTIGEETYKRQKISPSKLRELRAAQREYTKDVEKMEDGSEARLDRDMQLVAFKAKLYLGMTDDQFNDTDYEYLQQVIQATELRGNGFRKC